MRQVIQSGVKTKVLMLSATPVNNRLADLKNQIAFITEGRDDALCEHGLPSVEATVRLAQTQFNRWQQLAEEDRRPARLMDMLGFDYFRCWTCSPSLARASTSRSTTAPRRRARFPSGCADQRQGRRRLCGLFPPIAEINTEIRRLNLSAYAPLRTCCPASRRSTTPKTALPSAAANASSARSTAKRA
jgi:hypothetical protein